MNQYNAVRLIKDSQAMAGKGIFEGYIGIFLLELTTGPEIGDLVLTKAIT